MARPSGRPTQVGAAAGIELRQQGVEELQGSEAFDLAYVAQVFIPDDV